MLNFKCCSKSLSFIASHAEQWPGLLKVLNHPGNHHAKLVDGGQTSETPKQKVQSLDPLIDAVTGGRFIPRMHGGDVNFIVFMYSCHKVKTIPTISQMKLHCHNEMHFTDKEECHFHKWKHCQQIFMREFPKSYLNCLDSCVVYITSKQCQGFLFPLSAVLDVSMHGGPFLGLL